MGNFIVSPDLVWEALAGQMPAYRSKNLRRRVAPPKADPNNADFGGSSQFLVRFHNWFMSRRLRESIKPPMNY
ncbi:MAG: hypothetical protein Q8P51_19205 [Ignavibacteria bacterium]|nr:hypothetical protein [Ignavibacteria bacterium]